jgi:hypothetical protein
LVRNILRYLFFLPLVALTILPVPIAHAKDHSSEYRVGHFSSTGQFSDGTYTSCGGRSCSSYTAGHNVHYVRTDDGMYTIEAPISVGKTLALGMLTDGFSPTIHKEWFMDQLHEGDQILFASKCNKHDHCIFYLPDPDKSGKEYMTIGYFEPDHAKTNTQTLCGKHKLAPEVEAQVCTLPASNAASPTTPADSHKALPLPSDVTPASAEASKAPATTTSDK